MNDERSPVGSPIAVTTAAPKPPDLLSTSEPFSVSETSPIPLAGTDVRCATVGGRFSEPLWYKMTGTSAPTDTRLPMPRLPTRSIPSR